MINFISCNFNWSFNFNFWEWFWSSILFLYDLSCNVEKFGEVWFFIFFFFLEFWGSKLAKGLFESFAIFYSEKFSPWRENKYFFIICILKKYLGILGKLLFIRAIYPLYRKTKQSLTLPHTFRRKKQNETSRTTEPTLAYIHSRKNSHSKRVSCSEKKFHLWKKSHRSHLSFTLRKTNLNFKKKSHIILATKDARETCPKNVKRKMSLFKTTHISS